MTHGPPHRILDRINMGVFVGCEALAPRLEQIRPALCVFGHIHEARGAVIREWEDDGTGRRRRTVYVNAAVQAGHPNRSKEVSRLESLLDIGRDPLTLLPLVHVQETGRENREVSSADHRRSKTLILPFLFGFWTQLRTMLLREASRLSQAQDRIGGLVLHIVFVYNFHVFISTMIGRL